MKKLLLIAILMLALVFTVVACNNEPVVDDTTADTTVAENPTAEPTDEPTAEPTAEPTDEPTAEPTDEPTAEPTAEPTDEPTAEPTAEPTEPETTDPSDPVFMLDPETLNTLAGAAAPNVNQLGSTEVITEGNTTFVRWTAAGGDPYVAIVPLGSSYTLPQYVAIRYRTNSTVGGQFFVGSGAGWTGAGDSFTVDWVEGDWGFMIIDLTQTGVTSITDGVLTYARLDFFAGDSAEGDYFDIAYVGIFNSAEYAAAYDFEMTKAPMWDADKSVIMHQNFDQFYYGNGDQDDAVKNDLNLYHAVNKPEWNFVADMVGTDHTYVTYWGWVVLASETVGQFGYQIGMNAPIFDDAWTVVAEQGVLDAAASLGGATGTRMRIHVNVADLDGENLVRVLYKDAEGNVVCLNEVTVIMPAKPTHYENYTVPQDQWVMTGHNTQLNDASNGMVAAGGVESAALLHQGSIALGEVDLSKYSKVVVMWGCDNSQVTIDHYNNNANNRIMLLNAVMDGVMSPVEETIIAGGTYELGGWAVQAFEIDLTGVNYNGPVWLAIDALPGTFALFSSVEFIGGEIDYSKPVEPETPAEPEAEDLVIDIANTTAVATDPAWIPNQALLGPHNAADDTTGQIGAINKINNNFLGETGYGNIIVGGYISVGEIDLSKFSSVTLLVAGGGAGQSFEGWMTDAEGNKLNAENATFTAGAVGVEGTQTIRTITIDFDTEYNGEVRFLFTQAQVVTVVGITFNA